MSKLRTPNYSVFQALVTELGETLGIVYVKWHANQNVWNATAIYPSVLVVYEGYDGDGSPQSPSPVSLATFAADYPSAIYGDVTATG